MASIQRPPLSKELFNVVIVFLIVSGCLWGIWLGFKETVLTDSGSSSPVSLSTDQYYEEVIESLSKDLERYPSHVETLILRGTAHCALKWFVDCLQDYDKALQLAPSEGRLYQFRGRAFAAMGKLAEAVSDFTEWININSSDPSGYFERAEVYLKQGKWEEASADLSSITRLGGKPKTLEGLEGVHEALELEHEGKLLEALEIYRKLKQRSGYHKSYAIVMVRMADLLVRLNEKGLGLEILEELHENNPWDQQVRKMREKLLYPQGIPTIDIRTFPATG